tara:strand:+ start:68 stop:268 length:201 start_codon:yes stop_codon:yes gene_type:complete
MFDPKATALAVLRDHDDAEDFDPAKLALEEAMRKVHATAQGEDHRAFGEAIITLLDVARSRGGGEA